MRPPREEESAAIAALLSEFAPEAVTDERVRSNWSAPGVDMERDARVVVRNSDIVGFAALEREGDAGAPHLVWLELHGDGIDELLDWALSASTGRLFSGGWQQNRAVGTALRSRGFTLVRHSYRMKINLESGQPAPEWPEGIAVRTFTAGDERLVYETHMETFEDSWEHVRQPYEQWAHWSLGRPGFNPALWFLAMAGEEVAGIALCRVRPDATETGWISILGVRRPWRRRGLGRALLLHGFGELLAGGCRQAVLGVDAESVTGANLLYESVGMSSISTFDIYEQLA